MKQATSGLQFLHSLNKVHRDIKPGNILVTKDMNNALLVKITDFGLARSVHKSGMQTVCGTPIFIAPEIYNIYYGKREMKYTSKVDIFSLGLVFLAIIQDRPDLLPIGQGLTSDDVIGVKMTANEQYVPVVKNGSDEVFVEQIKGIILETVTFQPERRLSASQLKRKLDSIILPEEVSYWRVR